MPEKEMEGLEAGEILDELDVEVPTAASNLENPEITVIYNYKGKLDDDLEPGKLHHDIKALVVPEEQRRKTAILGLKINGDELVRREDYREALVEAVQHGAEQERRRIQDKIEKMLEAPNKGASCNGCGWKGHASELDIETLPSDMGRDEVWKWDCPNCGDQAQPVQLEIGSNLEFLLEELEEEVSEDA